MKRTKVIVTMLILSLLLSNISIVAADPEPATLVPQGLDYTEYVGDVPNPDRGYYRANDSRVVPVTGAVGGAVTGANGSSVSPGGATTQTRIVQAYFDLRQYSDLGPTANITGASNYTAGYRAPEGQVGTVASGAPYRTHWAYWKDNVWPTGPKGTSQPITADGLAYIRNVMQQCRDGNASIIMRFNYCGTGWAWREVEHPIDGDIDDVCGDIEPDKATILGHIAQLKPIFEEYEDVIMGVDGGFFGPWGEMHSTTFATSREANAWLLDALLDAVPASRSIMVHAGAYLSWHNAKYGTNYNFSDIDTMPAPELGTPEARFGFFNDSYGATRDDWGSLNEGTSMVGGTFNRGKTMTWIRKQNNFYGGEAQSDGATNWNVFPWVGWEASYAQTTYLNNDYQAAVHNRWGTFTYNEANVTGPTFGSGNTYGYSSPYHVSKAFFDPVYDGKTGAEYWRDRLGYRFVLRDANASDEVQVDGTLEFEGKVQNVGFGNQVNKKDVSVILLASDGTTAYTALTDIDSRLWRPNLDSRATNTAAHHDVSFAIDLEDFDTAPPAGEYDIYLKIQDAKETTATKRAIQFANNGGIYNATIAANKIGSTEVVDAPVAPVPLTSISLNASTLDLLDDGATATLAVTYDPVDTTDDKTVTWTTDNKSVATVVDGVVTPHAVGDATITARVGNLTATCAVTVDYTVTPKPLTAISLDKTTLAINEGATDTLTVIYAPADTTDPQTVTWSTDNKTVATVVGGVVTAVAPGTATITAKVGNFTATCDVTINHLVTPKPLTSISLDAATLSMTEGDSDTLTVAYDPVDTTDDKTVTWSTDNKSVATVAGGVVTAVAAGEADITAKVGNFTATCVVTVEALPPTVVKSTSITLNHNAISLKAGTSQSLGTTIQPANVTSHHKTWKSSNEAVATVDSVGKITAKKVGTANITVTTTDSGKTDVCKVTVTPAKIAKPAKVTKVKAKVGKTKANISWKKASKALGYQITYSTDKKFKKGKATNTITINKAVTKKLIKQLKSNKTYYFRVRAINKNADGKTQYGKWSNKIKAKIK